jgi:hypothetical protein
MAFTSERDGNGEIYVMGADGSAPVNITNAPSRELSPDWQALPIPGVGPLPTGEPPRDRTAPRIRLRMRSRQSAHRTGSVRFSVSCDESCSVTASGRVRLKGKRTRLALGRARGAIVMDTRTTFRLKLSRNKRRTIRRALRSGRLVTATVRVSARDGVGNASSLRRVVQIVQ